MLLFVMVGGAIFIVALCDLGASVVGLVVRQNHPWRFAGLLLIGSLILGIIGYMMIGSVLSSPPQQYYDVSDPEIRPFIDAINAVDRQALGFTPILPHTPISLGRTVGSKATYDVMMYINNPTQRTIAFKQQGDTYIWLGEQETHRGPGTYSTEGGQMQEEIVINYETVYLSGFPLNTVAVEYSGRDPRLYNKTYLTLQDVRPILQEWEQEKIIATPEVP
jgi:hypothetical protein